MRVIVGWLCALVLGLSFLFGFFYTVTKEVCDEGQTKVEYVVYVGEVPETATSCVPVEDAIGFIERHEK